MTHFFPSGDHPQGWKLEDLLSEIQSDIIRRSEKIVDDTRPQARAVLHNNIEIMSMLTQCIHKAMDSTKILESLGRSKSDHGGTPRIGHL
ncbi:MAG: histidine kinase [Alphaproteobacteria bacterium]